MDQLNLRPQERRVLVIVLCMVFVVLNWIFVRPLFGQWGQVQLELEKTRKTLAQYEAEIAKTPRYEALEKELKVQGTDIFSEELQLQRIIDQHATAAGVPVSRYVPGVRAATGRTNQFFEDQGLTIEFTTFSTNLVEFLVALASGNSMIRVQEMNLRPDGTKTKLNGNIQFVASYQKKVNSRAAVAAATAKPSSARPNPAPASTAKTNSPATATNTVKANAAKK